MFKRPTIFLLFFIIVASSLFAQTVTSSVAVLGVSPRDAAISTTDIYTYPSTGLTNVGVGSIMYFKASVTGQKFAAPAWSITKRPSGSTSSVGTVRHIIDEYNQVVTYTPNKPGSYEITFTDGAITKSITFNAANYLGYQNTVVGGVDTKLSCNTCHSSKVADYKKTRHAVGNDEKLDGINAPTYRATCVPCHTTGNDANPTAINDGFDDLPFTFPTVIGAGNAAKAYTQFPEAMKRSNIQCESCHGPASGHLGVTTDSRMTATYDAAVCAYCHNSGTHHIYPEQWNSSAHAVATKTPSGAGRESCVRCHTAAGFAQFTAGVSTTDPYFDVTYSPLTCAACHDPHKATNKHQLRAATAQLITYNPNDVKTPTYTDVKEAGMGTMCINCHQARREANQSVDAVVSKTSSSLSNSHYGAQGDMLFSNNMLELGGVKLAVSNHKGAAVDACVRCHMYSQNALTGSTVNLWGGHSFSMSTPKKDTNGNYLTGIDGRRLRDKDNMDACAQCHGSTFGGSFDEVKFFFNGNGDHDNNGIVEGLQKEVKGMIIKIMDRLATTIPGVTRSTSTGIYKDDGTFVGFPNTSQTWSKTQLSAYWNAYIAYADHSGGIHNPKYIISGLRGAMAALGVPTAVEQEESIPSTYALYQNYPNPFNPTTRIKFSLPNNGHVRITIYDAVGREVETLVNSDLAAGTHNVEWTAKNMASGIYLYRIQTGNFVKVNKMLLVK
ncbi:MAG: hypothetical protein CVV24_11560 [Ignavibacteriae bacterium HGW-Ignavibacteriae-3]|nr:MAG: hypothetical protein CVV24_11560 [Ignavibacteriae bacterium HGW-Ignavibacteriae-3]